MARPVSWLPRLPALARAVGESVRSHYTCSDIEDHHWSFSEPGVVMTPEQMAEATGRHIETPGDG